MSSSEKGRPPTPRGGSAKGPKAKAVSTSTRSKTPQEKVKDRKDSKDKIAASTSSGKKQPKQLKAAATQSDLSPHITSNGINGDLAGQQQSLANGHLNENEKSPSMSSVASTPALQDSMVAIQERLAAIEDRLSVVSGPHCHAAPAEENLVIAMSQLALTKPAPPFSGTAVVDGDFKQISLSDYKGKYLVFFFYPLDFTFVCPTELIAFSDRADEFRAINCELVACSTDSHFSHLAWISQPRKQGGLGEMKMPLLADKNCDIAKAYGVYKEDDGIAFRGLFVIDGKGNLRQITINDLPVGRSVDEVLRLVQAFQFTDKHGEVCPAGWKPGSKTMKPDPKGSKSYFQEAN